MVLLRTPFLLLTASCWAATALVAQCDPQWQPGDPLPHVSDRVHAVTSWDPDGAGPLPLQLVVGGSFQVGTSVSSRIAAFDGTQWLPLGDPGDTVRALAVFGGQLIVATAGTDPRIQAWTGSAWQPLGNFGQVGGQVYAFGVFQGALIAAGSFFHVDGTAANNIASWNGSAWSALGGGVNGAVNALAVFGSALHVGGSFSQAGGVAVGNHASWNGSAWAAGAVFNGVVETFAVRTATTALNTHLFAGGTFTSLSAPGSGTLAAQHVARLNAATGLWTALGAGVPGTTCKRLFARAVGLSGYELTAATDTASTPVWRWTGATWSALGYVEDTAGPVVPSALAYWNNQYVLGLSLADVAVRSFDSTAGWLPVNGHGIDGTVYAACAADDEVVIAGEFRRISGVQVNGIARGAAGAWQPLGSGLEGGFGPFAVATMPNGDIVAGGSFTTAGGLPIAHLARWNGSAWSSLGSGVNDIVYALCPMPNGDLVAAGRFTVAGGIACNRIARWNGTTWSPLGSGSPSQINTLRLAANGDLLVGGNFVSIGGIAASRIARWNGSTWSALGGGVDSAVWTVVELPNGDVVVGGHFATAGGVVAPHVARWNGSAWSAVGSQSGYWPQSDVSTLVALPNGDLLAGGAEWSYSFSIPGFPPVTWRSALARWDGQQGGWRPMDVHGSSVTTGVWLPNGDVVIGGRFERAGGLSLGNVARLRPPCAAAALSVAPGCPSSGGNNLLVATTLPWADGTFHATGTGLPPFAAVFAVTSFQALVPPFPLAAVFAEAVPGCDLHVAADILEGMITTTGRATSTLALPNMPPLVGLSFYHQMVPIELGPQGQFVAMTSTNALRLTVGVF